MTSGTKADLKPRWLIIQYAISWSPLRVCASHWHISLYNLQWIWWAAFWAVTVSNVSVSIHIYTSF